MIWDAALWHQGGINRSRSPRWTVIAFYLRAWLKGKSDSARMLSSEAIEKMSAEARRLVGILTAPPDYSEVKVLDPQQLESLTFEQRKVLGFAVY